VRRWYLFSTLFLFSKKINTKLNVLLHSTAVHNNLKWKRKEKEVSTKNCNFAFIIYAMLYIKFIKTTAINIQTTVAAAEWTDSELQFQLMEKNAKGNCFWRKRQMHRKWDEMEFRVDGNSFLLIMIWMIENADIFLLGTNDAKLMVNWLFLFWGILVFEVYFLRLFWRKVGLVM